MTNKVNPLPDRDEEPEAWLKMTGARERVTLVMDFMPLHPYRCEMSVTPPCKGEAKYTCAVCNRGCCFMHIETSPHFDHGICIWCQEFSIEDQERVAQMVKELNEK
jgi:hypothetical protein